MRPFKDSLFLFALIFLSQAGIVLAGTDGSLVNGKVAFRGSLPIAKTLPVNADEETCGNDAVIQTVQVNKDTLGLHSVVVSVKNPPSVMGHKALSNRIVMNTGCVFFPRVGAARLGDILEIHNRDPILHNTHIKKGKKTFLNVAQLVGSRPIPKTLKRTGLLSLRCDKHTFMTGALLVFDHPYFVVTDELGDFQLPSLPARTYTIVVWHETLGSLEQNVTVPSQGSVTINFDYL